MSESAEVHLILQFWDSPEAFPDTLNFGMYPIPDGRGKLLSVVMQIEGLEFCMIPIPVGQA